MLPDGPWALTAISSVFVRWDHQCPLGSRLPLLHLIFIDGGGRRLGGGTWLSRSSFCADIQTLYWCDSFAFTVYRRWFLSPVWLSDRSSFLLDASATYKRYEVTIGAGGDLMWCSDGLQFLLFSISAISVRFYCPITVCISLSFD